MDSSSRPYLSLLELGMFLETMSKTHGGTVCYMKSFFTFYFCIHVELVSLKRPLPDGLKIGESNLLVVSSGIILYVSSFIPYSKLLTRAHRQRVIVVGLCDGECLKGKPESRVKYPESNSCSTTMGLHACCGSPPVPLGLIQQIDF